MRRLDPAAFSSRCAVRYLTGAELPALERLCRSNPLYYRCIGEEPDAEALREMLSLLPPGKDPDSKYFVGFYKNERLLAVLDLIDGYPDGQTAYIGFFMVDAARSGRGLGTALIGELCEYLRAAGFSRVRLAYGVNNPQAARFWTKNAFVPLRRVEHSFGQMIAAERDLGGKQN